MNVIYCKNTDVSNVKGDLDVNAFVFILLFVQLNMLKFLLNSYIFQHIKGHGRTVSYPIHGVPRQSFCRQITST